MTPKPKKHKQRFEHFIWHAEQRNVDKVIKQAEKVGYELVAAVPKHLTLGSKFWTLFFKRPV